MEISEYKNIFANEENNFIYVSRHLLILTLFRKFVKKKRPSILDAGCGTGLLAKKLEKFGTTWGVDISPEALKFAKTRSIKVKRASVTKLPFRKSAFDVLTSVDVIYHKAIKDDAVALQEFFRVLKPGGLLIMRVPANRWLRLNHDKHVHTRQRYEKGELRHKLLHIGFVIEKISYVDFTILPLAILQSLIEKVAPPNKTNSYVKSFPYIINQLLINILSFEVLLVSKFNLPFGIGLVAVCKKPLSDKISPGKKTRK